MNQETNLARGFARALGMAADDERLRRYIHEGRGELPPSARLLSWEANSIHAFVFDTTNATGIRGASDILDQLDEKMYEGGILGLQPEQVLYAGGGGGVAIVGQGEVEPTLRRLHALFARRTRIATCTATAVELTHGHESFAERMEALARALARERVRVGPDAEVAVPFFAARCAVCGRRAAAQRLPRGSDRRLRLECAPCHLRIERGKQDRHYSEEPSDFANIADDGGRGFYSVVYLDGNGIGRFISDLKSPLDYAAFSAAMKDVMERSFRETIDRYGLSEEAGGVTVGRYQRPICGGDDLVAILPGEVAVPLTRDLVRALERNADADETLREVDLGAAAGVAVSKVGYPVRHLLDEAEALLKIAKRRVYATGVRSALAFAVITDGSPRSESTEPERWLRENDDLLLSGSPYALDELEELSRRLAILRQIPNLGRSQLYALERVAPRGWQQLRNHVLYQLGRRREWRDWVVRLAGGDESVLASKERCVDLAVPLYGGRRVFDGSDIIQLRSHWREPGPKEMP